MRALGIYVLGAPSVPVKCVPPNPDEGASPSFRPAGVDERAIDHALSEPPKRGSERITAVAEHSGREPSSVRRAGEISGKPTIHQLSIDAAEAHSREQATNGVSAFAFELAPPGIRRDRISSNRDRCRRTDSSSSVFLRAACGEEVVLAPASPPWC